MSSQSPMSPGLQPPPGIEPYFQGAYTVMPFMTMTMALSVFFTTVLLFARVYTKVALIRPMNLEDYSAILGWAAFIAFVGIQQTRGHHGGGAHQWNVYLVDVQYNKRWANYGDMVYSISLLSTKLSIMLLILRVFCSVQHDIPYYLTILTMAVNTAFYICFLIVPAALCKPREKIWMPEVEGMCLDINKLYLASSTFNFLSDIAMLSVPVYLVWQLQMSVRRKVGISAIFCTGGLACLASIFRLIWVVALTHSEDFTFIHLGATVWAIAEIAFGLICSNVVVLPRLYRHFCEIQPYTAHTAHTATRNALNGTNTKTEEARKKEMTDGKSKREWVQLEERAERDKRKFAERGKLRDEEAFDVAVEEDGVKRQG